MTTQEYKLGNIGLSKIDGQTATVTVSRNGWAWTNWVRLQHNDNLVFTRQRNATNYPFAQSTTEPDNDHKVPEMNMQGRVQINHWKSGDDQFEITFTSNTNVYGGNQRLEVEISNNANGSPFRSQDTLVIQFNITYADLPVAVTSATRSDGSVWEWDIDESGRLDVRMITGSSELARDPDNTFPWDVQAPKITTIVLRGFDTIGESAFYSQWSDAGRNYTRLNNVDWDAWRGEIKGQAFAGCSELISFGDGVSGATSIGSSAFLGTQVYRLMISPELTSIGAGAFKNCGNLHEVIIKWGVSSLSVGGEAFYGCTNLKTIYNYSSITLTPGDVTGQGGIARQVTNYNTFPPENTWQKCGENMEWMWSRSESAITFRGSGVGWDQSYSNIPLWNLIPLTEVTVNLGEGITRLGNGAFELMGNGGMNFAITNINLPESFINQTGFNSISVSTIYIGPNIEDDFTVALPVLKEIRLNENNPRYCLERGMLLSKDKTKLLMIPQGKEGLELFPPNSVRQINPHIATSDNIISADYRNIDSFTYSYTPQSINRFVQSLVVSEFIMRYTGRLEYLTKATISEGVNKIPANAFSNCASLSSVFIPPGVTQIGANAFQGTNLTKLDIPAGVQSIGWRIVSDRGIRINVWGTQPPEISLDTFHGSFTRPANELNQVYILWGAGDKYKLASVWGQLIVEGVVHENPNVRLRAYIKTTDPSTGQIKWLKSYPQQKTSDSVNPWKRASVPYMRLASELDPGYTAWVGPRKEE